MPDRLFFPDSKHLNVRKPEPSPPPSKPEPEEFTPVFPTAVKPAENHESKEDTVVVSDTIYSSETVQERIARANKEADDIVSDMYKSIDGLGTDDKLLEKALDKVDADNIFEVIKLWEKTCGKEYNETFIESFLNDADSNQRKVYGKKLMDALVERGKMEGLYNTSKQVEAFDKELNSKFIVSNGKLAEHFNFIVDGLKFFTHSPFPVKGDQTPPEELEASRIVYNMYRAIDGPGTDDKIFEESLDKINEDNIIEVYAKWGQTQGLDCKEDFFTSFLNDADNKQRAKYGIKMLEALEARAVKAGINNIDSRSERFETEMNSAFVDNKVLAEQLYSLANDIIANETVRTVTNTDGDKPEFATPVELPDTVYINQPVVLEDTVYVDRVQVGTNEDGTPKFKDIYLKKLGSNEEMPPEVHHRREKVGENPDGSPIYQDVLYKEVNE